MRVLGITQDGARSALRQPSAEFRLPAEATPARRTVTNLRLRAAAVRRRHTFRTGMGLAAPQIGVRRRAAIVYLVERDELIVLLNPHVVDASDEVETRYEGCLSFFDVRGRVERPVRLVVAHQRPDGSRTTTAFEGSVARLVAHEIDHLDGILYTQRMADERGLLPVERYRETEAAGN